MLNQYPQVRLNYLKNKKKELYESMELLSSDECFVVEDELEEIEDEIASLQYVVDDVAFLEEQQDSDDLVGFSKFEL